MNRQYISRLSQVLPGLRKNNVLNASYIYHADVTTPAKPMSRRYSEIRRDDTTDSQETLDRPCKMFTTIGKIFNGFSSRTCASNKKVSVIGLDDIGMATIYTLLSKNITNDICMIDLDEDVLLGEQMDLQFSSLFLNNPNISSSKDFAHTRDSKICIVTTGTYRGRDEKESEYIGRNTGIIRALIPPLVKYSPGAIFIVASDPVDILSYMTWKLSGFPKNRIIGTGTMLDTAKFRYLVSEKFGISPTCCHAYIIGQHGENSVPLWSSATVGGVRLKELNPQIGSKSDPEKWNELHMEVVKSDEIVRQMKGSVSWTVALAVAELCNCIITNSKTIMPVSTYVTGEHGIRDEIFLSFPCVVGNSGVTDLVRQILSEDEARLLRKGADNISEILESANKILTL